MKYLSFTFIILIISLQSFSQGNVNNGDVGKFLAEFRMIPGTAYCDNSYITIRGGKFRISLQEVTKDSLYLFQFRNQRNKVAQDNRGIIFTRQELKNFENAIGRIVNNNAQKLTLTNCSVMNLSSDSFNGIVVTKHDGWCLMSGKTTRKLLKVVRNLSRSNANSLKLNGDNKNAEVKE